MLPDVSRMWIYHLKTSLIMWICQGCAHWSLVENCEACKNPKPKDDKSLQWKIFWISTVSLFTCRSFIVKHWFLQVILRDLKSCLWGNPMFSSWLTPGRPWSTCQIGSCSPLHFELVELDLIPFFLLKNEASLKDISSYIHWKIDMYTVKGELLKESFIFQAAILSAKAVSFSGG